MSNKRWLHDLYRSLRDYAGSFHAQYHRGQNAARLRELGGEPPTTDYIVWLWKGRPQPAW